MSAVHVILPDWIDDARRPSGGNVYDRRVCDELPGLGWAVHEHPVGGAWPDPSSADLTRLAAELEGLADGELVLVDGLIGSAAAPVLVQEAQRLRLIPLVHLPLGTDPDRIPDEKAVLEAASAVVTTSRWTRNWLLDTYGGDGQHLHVAEPGVERAPAAPGTAAGGELLCVAAVTPSKGHDVLVAALASIADLTWHCTCVGSRELDRAFAGQLLRRARRAGIGDRITFTGALTGDALAEQYAKADVAVLASRLETYGMVVTEALAHGLPVIATQVGGVGEALGRVGDDRWDGRAAWSSRVANRPGVLVPADDPDALATELRAWLTHAGRRERLRAAARQRRHQLRGWDETARCVSDALNQAMVRPVSSVRGRPLTAERGR
jgi:glycosyltransferase involved in cell wall biosynthesis